MAVDFTKTAFGDIDLEFVKHYMRIEPDMTEDDLELQLIIDTAKDFVLNHTQLTIEELNANKSANIVYLKLISDLYHKRTATDGGNIDPIFDLMLKNLRKFDSFFGTAEDTTTV